MIGDPFVDEYLRGRADRHKPLYRELREEGLTQPAIEFLHEGRDMLELRWNPYGFAKWLPQIAKAGVTEDDVWPNGRPEPEPLPMPDPATRMAWEWLELDASHMREWDTLEASWVAEWAAADAPDAHKACAEIYWEDQL